MKTEIENLIIKFLTKEADLCELQQLEMWISNPENESLFSEYIKTNNSINRAMFRYNKNDAKANVISFIRREKNILNKRRKIIKDMQLRQLSLSYSQQRYILRTIC